MILKEHLRFVVRCSSENSFTNKIYGMQKAGMNVSGITPPVTNKTSSKDLIKITGYTKEDGLYERLLNQFRKMTMPPPDDEWES